MLAAPPITTAMVLVESPRESRGFARFVSEPLAEARSSDIYHYLALQPISANRQTGFAESAIDLIGDLASGWNGYGAIPISPMVCMNAKRFLRNSPSELHDPDITPTSNGTVNFEWTSNDADAYLDIGETRYTGHIQTKSGEIFYLDGILAEHGNHDPSGIQQALALISGLLHATPPAPSIAQNL